MIYPLNTVVSQPSADSQREFAVEALKVVASQPARVRADATEPGLLLWGITELDLEQAFDLMKTAFPSAKCGKPNVVYLDGPPLMEPCYQALIESPEEHWAALMSDLAARRGVVQGIEITSAGKRATAEIPVSECFGYHTSVRALTSGRGSCDLLHVARYIEAGSYGGENDAV